MQPEGRYIKRIERLLPEAIHAEPMRGMFSNGIPDRYYEGPDGLAWVEYKWLAYVPRTPFKPNTTALQRNWLNRAHRNRKPAAVIVGCPLGGVVVVAGAWNDKVAPDVVPNETVADWIIRMCCHTRG